MKSHSKIAFLGAKASQAFTLIEMMIAVVISVFVIASILTLFLISMQNYAATANYVRMNDQSRNIMDRISREIRNASGLSTNNTTLFLTNATSGITSTVTYNSSNGGWITLTDTQGTQTILTNCTTFSIQLYTSQITNNYFSFYNTNAAPNSCKAISLHWKCAKPITGSKSSTEIVQEAQVMLRNK